MSAIGGKAGCDRDSSDLGELGEFGGIAEVAVVIALCVLAPSPREKFVQFSVQRCPGFGQRLDCLAHSTDPSVTTAPADFLERLDAIPWPPEPTTPAALFFSPCQRHARIAGSRRGRSAPTRRLMRWAGTCHNADSPRTVAMTILPTQRLAAGSASAMSHRKCRIALVVIAMAPLKTATKSRSPWVTAGQNQGPRVGKERSAPVDLAPYPNCSRIE